MIQKIALIAGQGQLPLFIAGYAQKAGIDCHVISLKHLGNEGLSTFKTISYALTELEAIIGYLKRHDIRHIIMAGKIHREVLAAGPIDPTSADLLQKALPLGDDAALKAVLAYLNQEGIEVLPTSVCLPDHQLPAGFDNASDKGDISETINHAITLHSTLGQFDIGQALIIQDKRVLSIEGAEGTDAMIERTVPFIDKDSAHRLFFKAAKSGQNKLLDPPVIGEETIKLCAKAGINIVAIEAHHCLLSRPKDEIDSICQSHGIRLVSVTMPEPSIKEKG